MSGSLLSLVPNKRIKKGRKIINQDQVDHQACRLSHFVYVTANMCKRHVVFYELISPSKPYI